MSGDLPDDFSSAAFRRYWGDDAAGRAEELARQWTHEVMSYNLAIAVVLKKAIDSVTNFGPPRYFTAKGYDYTEIVSSITDMIPDTSDEARAKVYDAMLDQARREVQSEDRPTRVGGGAQS